MIKVAKHPNAISYKLKNRRIIIDVKDNNGFEIQFKTLLILNDEEKKEYSSNNNCNMRLTERHHSKFCVWINRLILSKEAMDCIFHSEQFIDKIKPIKK